MLGRLAALHSLGTFRGLVDPRGGGCYLLFFSESGPPQCICVFPSFVLKTFTMFYFVLSVCGTVIVQKSESLINDEPESEI